MKHDLTTLRIIAFCAALILYGAYSSPTPDHLGWVETLIGGLLVLSLFPASLPSLSINHAAPLWKSFASILLIFGLTFPLITAALSNAPIHLILRDILPFGFMMLPLFMAPLFTRRPSLFKPVLAATLSIGILFAMRSVSASITLPVLSQILGPARSLDYLANMPTMLMAAIFFTGTALTLFIKNFTPKNLGKALILVSLAALALTPIILTQQRASLGIFTLAIALILSQLLWQRPRRTLALLAISLILSIPFWPEVTALLGTLQRKSNLVGLNMRLEDLGAIWQTITSSPLSLLFGKGWGAGFSSPAVADIYVHFTHSLLSGMLLKTGLIGLLLTGLYLYALTRILIPIYRARPTLVLALALPLLIDIFLYASYKSLDFGLLLMLIPTLKQYDQQKPNEA